MSRTGQASQHSTRTPRRSPPKWFLELLACPGCGHDRLDALDGWFYCCRCGHDLPVHKGIVHAVAPALQPWLDEQQRCWELLQEACPWDGSEGTALACAGWL